MNRTIFSRSFVLAFFSQMGASFSTALLIPTLPIYLSKTGAKEAEIGILIGVYSVTALAGRPFVGKALLRHPEKRFMMAGTLIYLLCSLAYLAAGSFFPLFVVRVFQGAGLACFSTAAFTFVTRIAPEAHRGQSLGYFYVSFNFSTAVAPALGMVIINRFDFNVLFLVCAGISLVALSLVLRLETSETTPLSDPAGKGQSFLNREALPPSIISAIGSILWGAITAFFPLFAVSHGVANPGYFFAAFAFTLVAVRVFGGKMFDIAAREKVILPCLGFMVISMVVLAFSTTLPFFILGAVLWGTGSAYFYPTMLLYAVERAGPSQRGPAAGTYTALGDFGAGLGSVIMGIVLELSSYRTMFLCLAFSGVLNAFLFYFFTVHPRLPTVKGFSSK